MITKQEAADALSRLLNQAIGPMVRDAEDLMELIQHEEPAEEVVEEVIEASKKENTEASNNGEKKPETK